MEEAKKEEEGKRRPLKLDWDHLLPTGANDRDEPPPVLVVATTVHEDDDDEPPHRSCPSMNSEPEHQSLPSVVMERMPDRELDEAIRRHRSMLDSMSARLPDKGTKLRFTLQRYEEEKERRRLRRLQPDANGCQMLMQSENSTAVGASDGFGKDAPSSKPHVQSSFASKFIEKMDKNHADCRAANAFDKDLRYLGHSNHRKVRPNGERSEDGRHRNQVHSRNRNFKCPRSLSLDTDSYISENGNQRGRTSSVNSVGCSGKDLGSCIAMKRNASEIHSYTDSRPHKVQTVVLVDEEEPQPIETTEQADRLSECAIDTKIYYPSRDDAEAVEICYADIKCLDPEAYLSSTIMNFYIRYLQQLTSPTDRARHDYHFFNTYFYEKLKEAVSKRGGKEASFIKFRRWWKGVNIFQKAYILIPIHEDVHWSLVIICIPDKEDESGPIILHLDSLRLHCSKLIFSNIRSFLTDEWSYINQEVAPPDVPIADGVWKQLSRRINDRILQVPQQRNDYDCGLFVLFFMERFIEEAPERLKKIDLAMFGKQWFRPEEASGLRRKIKALLFQEFKSASDEQNCITES